LNRLQNIILAVGLLSVTSTHASDLRVHELNSERQSGVTRVRVILPDSLRFAEGTDRQMFRTLYVLPVEAGAETRWGNSVEEVLKWDLQNRHQLICVFPEFSDLPWYADHPDNSRLQQESYLLKDVVPMVERIYPTKADEKSRLLVGFSKSGWGAWSLLIRNPDVFSRAAAFDAPLTMAEAGQFGSGPIFGSQENFQKYCLTTLLPKSGERFHQAPVRLGLLGRGHFYTNHQQMIQMLSQQGILHEQIPGEIQVHSWNSGWLPDAVNWLAGP
jgi:hypothetical protein